MVFSYSIMILRDILAGLSDTRVTFDNYPVSLYGTPTTLHDLIRTPEYVGGTVTFNSGTLVALDDTVRLVVLCDTQLACINSLMALKTLQ